MQPRGDDALDILALDSLHITFEHEFPLQLVLSSRALQLHHEVFALLLRLRRARWALEAPLATALDAVGVQRFSAALASHSWLVLRASLRHLVCQLYAHFAQGVIEAEWARFRAAAAAARGVDAFRCAHEAFIVRVAEGCLLMPRFAPTLHAMKELLALTLRLRWQFESLPARRAATGRRSSPSRRAGKRKFTGACATFSTPSEARRRSSSTSSISTGSGLSQRKRRV